MNTNLDSPKGLHEPQGANVPAHSDAGLAGVCQSLGLTVQSTPATFKTDSEGWDHFAFRVSIARNGKEIWDGDYRMGIACVKIPKGDPFNFPLSNEFGGYQSNILMHLQRNSGVKIKPEFEKEKRFVFQKLVDKQNPKPDVASVIHSLLLDGSAFLSGETFEEWCGNFGYDTDSRKAKAAYDTCLEIGMKMKRGFNDEELSQLQEAAQDF